MELPTKTSGIRLGTSAMTTRGFKEKEFLDQVVHIFGNTIIEKGEFCPQKLADIVFNDNQALEKLNSLIHPKVLEKYKLWQSKQTFPYTILESAIIFEIGWQKHFDKIINIETPIEIAIERVKLRDNISQDQVLQRINNQMPWQTKKKLSDYNIYHDNNTMLLPQIIAIHENILEQITFPVENNVFQMIIMLQLLRRVQ